MVKKIKKENIKTKNTNIYLYDFDGTIVKGDTGVKFFWWCQKQNKSLIKWVPYYAICTLLYCLKSPNGCKQHQEQIFSVKLRALFCACKLHL